MLGFKKRVRDEGPVADASGLSGAEQVAGNSTTAEPSSRSSPTKRKVSGRPPYFLALRSSTPFIALTVGLGVLVDLSGYGLAVPVLPFRLEELGYDNIESKTGWLVAAYAAGLIVSSPPIAYIGATVRNRRIPLLIALLFMAGAIILFMETHSYTALVISRVLQGVSGTGLWTLGLALITDSVPEARVGIVMGYVMIGFSVGQLIGPPVGGVLYQRMGYRAPFVFALCLIFADFVLRILVIEKHTALAWIESGLVDIPDFEAPGYVSPAAQEKLAEEEAQRVEAGEKAEVDSGDKPKKEVRALGDKEVSTWAGLISMCSQPRPVTLFLLTGLNGITLGGLLDTSMTLYGQEFYGLSTMGVGLIFLSAIVPTIFVSPLVGGLCDKWGAKWIGAFGVALSIAAYPLLVIRGPLPLFCFFLVLVGTSLASFLTPVTHDLAAVVAATPGLASTYAFACFNLCYSVGSFIGPIMAGQISSALGPVKGWMVMSLICTGLSVVLFPFCVAYIGGPLPWLARRRNRAGSKEGEEVQEGGQVA